MYNNYIGKIISGYEILEKTTQKDTSSHYLYKCRCIHCDSIELKSIRTLNQQKGVRCSHFDKFGFPNPPYTFSVDRDITDIFFCIKNRCYDKNSKDYKWYGAKGIKVCDEWLYKPINFSIWALNNGYKKGLTIDRIDNNKDYSPNNCRWISREENSRRAGTVNWITIDGETLSGRQWSNRINKGVNFVNNCLRKKGKEETIKEIRKFMVSLGA